MDTKDAEIARLTDELAHATKLFDAAKYLRDLVRKDEIDAERRRRKDGYRMPSNVWEIIEDSGVIVSARAVLDKMWHKENDDYRKAMMHLTKLEWDLRKKLRELL